METPGPFRGSLEDVLARMNPRNHSGQGRKVRHDLKKGENQ